MDSEVRASGFSKEIKEFDEVLDQIHLEKQNDENNNDSGEEEPKNESNTEEQAGACCSSVENSFNDPTEIAKELNEEDAYADELIDKFEDDLHIDNKQFKPYRDVNLNDQQDERYDSDESDNVSVTTSTIMDPGQVRAKVQKALLKRIKTEKRRIRNKGESALMTHKMREINDTIKSSFD